MTPRLGTIDDFGMDTISLAGPLPAKLRAIREAGFSQVMLSAREVKSHDEITLLNTAASMVDGVYQDITAALMPGVKESQIVALATKRLYEMGSDCVEAINAIAGERCSPHPHNFTDRLVRPGDQAYFDIIHSFMGYRTCYYRTFSVGKATPAQIDAYKRARQWMDDAISMLKPKGTVLQDPEKPGAGAPIPPFPIPRRYTVGFDFGF